MWLLSEKHVMKLNYRSMLVLRSAGTLLINIKEISLLSSHLL